MNFGKLLRQLRKEKGLTQAELARLISIGESTVSFYESGKRQPDYETLIRLANVFRVSVDQLLGHQKVNIEIYSNHHDNNQSKSYVAEASTAYGTHSKEPTLTKHDYRMIERESEYIKNAFIHIMDLAFYNIPPDEELNEEIIETFSKTMMQVKKEAEKKHIHVKNPTREGK